MIAKRMKVMPQNDEYIKEFIGTISDQNAYQIYKGYVQNNI
jgi:hypothetical protein